LEECEVRGRSRPPAGTLELAHSRARPEGPACNRPGRQAGIPCPLEIERQRRGTFRRDFFNQLTLNPVLWGMAGKYLSVNLHLVWSTKGRSHRLHAYLGSVATFKKARLIEVNSRPDHIHLYISMPSTISIADLVNALKANSTRWIRQTFPNRRWFSWQEGYAAFSVSISLEKVVIDYIRNQDEHHKRQGFQEELLDLLGRHGIEYDVRYVFD